MAPRQRRPAEGDGRRARSSRRPDDREGRSCSGASASERARRDEGGSRPLVARRSSSASRSDESLALAKSPPAFDAEHPLFILYTSGSTGKPKGVLHTTAGYLAGAHVTTKYVFDLRDDDVYWCTADVGWVTGHSYIVYGPLSSGATVPDVRGRAERARTGAASGASSSGTASRSSTRRRPRSARSSARATSGPQKHDLSIAAPARLGRRADQPRGLDLVPPRRSAAAAARSSTRGGRPRPARSCSRRCPARASRSPARRACRSSASTSRSSRTAATECKANEGGMLVIQQARGRRCCAPSGATTSASAKTYWSRDARRLLHGRRRAPRRGRLLLGRRPHRRRAQRRRPSHRHRRDRERARVPSRGRRGRRRRHAPTSSRARRSSSSSRSSRATRPARSSRRRSREHVAKEIGKFARPDAIRFTDALPKTRSGKIMRRLLKDVAAGARDEGRHVDPRRPRASSRSSAPTRSDSTRSARRMPRRVGSIRARTSRADRCADSSAFAMRDGR